MKILKILTPLLIALAMSTFTACSSGGSETNGTETKSYIINATENKDIPLDAQIKSVSTQDAKVKLTRNVEANLTNVYVISGSVEVTEIVE